MKSGVDYAKAGWEVMKKGLVNNIIVFFVASLTVMVLGIGIVSMFYCANKARKGEKLEIGKGGCDIQLNDDPYVSRRHARLTQWKGKVFLEDLESSNGTFFRIRSTHELEPGDEFVVGGTHMRLERIR